MKKCAFCWFFLHMYVTMLSSKNVKFGYYVVIVILVIKINVYSLGEFIDIPMVFIIISVTLVRYVAMF
jgi:hypothetical protein